MRKILAFVLLLATSFAALAQTPTGSITLQTRTPGSGGPTFDDIAAYTTTKTNFNALQFDMISDSRTANLYVSQANGPQAGLSGLNWFNQANALANQRYQLGINAGLSGCRTDQYLQDANFAAVAASNSLWVIFNFPAVNNLAAIGGSCAISGGNAAGTFPFVNSNGITVTQSNVGQVAADDIITRAKQVVAQGRNVILVEEPGATNLTAASVAQQYDLNARLRAFCIATPRCNFLSLNSAVYNPTGSTTLDTFATGVLLDGTTHYSVLGAYLQGVAFNSWFQSLVPGNANLLLASINNNTANNARQLINNPLFQTQTGGTNTTCALTGTVPSGWTLSCGVGTSTVAVTYVSDPSGFGGSCVQLVMTTAGVDTVRLQSNAPATSAWNLTDWFQASAVVTVAASSTNYKTFIIANVTTDAGGRNAYSVYGGDPATGGGANVGPTAAYTYTFLTPQATTVTGSSTKSFVVGPQWINSFTAAGGATATICRPSFNRIYTYNATAGFSGQ